MALVFQNIPYPELSRKYNNQNEELPHPTNDYRLYQKTNDDLKKYTAPFQFSQKGNSFPLEKR